MIGAVLLQKNSTDNSSHGQHAIGDESKLLMHRFDRESADQQIDKSNHRRQQIAVHRYWHIVAESAELKISEGKTQQQERGKCEHTRVPATLLLHIVVFGLGIRIPKFNSNRLLVPADQVFRHSCYPGFGVSKNKQTISSQIKTSFDDDARKHP